MSVSDLMTGLMILFLFIAIAYMAQVEDNQSILKDFVDNKKELHAKLVDQFKSEIADSVITIGGDLSMRFEQSESLFDVGSWQLKPEFQQQLRHILPKYLNILLTDSLRSKIREIRIEGHTDMMPYPRIDPDPYMANLILSQRRALSVMYFMRSLPEYQAYSAEDRRQLEYWFTANGLSYGRALDTEGNPALLTGLRANPERSRRVEFRIITAGEEVLERFVEENARTDSASQEQAPQDSDTRVVAQKTGTSDSLERIRLKDNILHKRKRISLFRSLLQGEHDPRLREVLKQEIRNESICLAIDSIKLDRLN